MSYKPIDSKRDQFRKYVESSGVVEMFSKVLIELFKREKHENPIDFIRENLGATLKEKVEIDFLKEEVNSYRHQVEELKKQLEDLQLQHQKYTVNQQQGNDIQTLSSPSQPITTNDKDDSSALSVNDVKSNETTIVEEVNKNTDSSGASAAITTVNDVSRPIQNEKDLNTEKPIQIIDETTTVATKATSTTPPPLTTTTTTTTTTSHIIEASTPNTQQTTTPTSTPPINSTINTTESVSDETAEKPTAT